MDWLSPVRSEFDDSVPDPGLPLSQLRGLLNDRQVARGSRILDVGCGDGSLVQWLDACGIDAVGVDWRPEAILRARAAAPHLTFKVASAAQPLAATQNGFDLILARDLPAHAADLASPSALLATAHLLAALRPGGDLVLLKHSPPGDMAVTHRRACFATHLGTFPGLCSVRFLPTPLSPRLVWKTVVARQNRGGHLAASLRTAMYPISLNQWRQIALRHAVGESCCDPAASPLVATLRAA